MLTAGAVQRFLRATLTAIRRRERTDYSGRVRRKNLDTAWGHLTIDYDHQPSTFARFGKTLERVRDWVDSGRLESPLPASSWMATYQRLVPETAAARRRA